MMLTGTLKACLNYLSADNIVLTPEPSTALLLALGLAGLAGMRRRGGKA